MKVICAGDFYGQQISDYLKNQIKSGKNYLYIARAEVLIERGKNGDLSPYFADTTKHFYNLTAYINGQVHKENNYLSQTDMYYILKKTFDCYFKDDNTKHTVYKNMYYSIFELYKFLLFHNVNVTDEFIKTLKETQSPDCFILFDIYAFYKGIIDSIIKAVRGGATTYTVKELDVTISVKSQASNDYDTFFVCQKKKIEQLIAGVDRLIIDGYFIFNDLESYLLSLATAQNKELIFITKNIKNDLHKDTIINDVFIKASNYDKTPEVIYLYDERHKETGLSYIQNNFYDCKPNSEVTPLLSDGSINTFKPFVSRNEELNFVATEIGQLIKACKFEDRESFIENDITITSPLRKDVTAKKVDETFKEIGYFIYRENAKKLFENEIDTDTFEKEYYSKKEFINQTILFVNGEELNHAQKSKFFVANFKRIKVSTPKISLANMPVLDFVFQLYDIGSKGITPKRFKALLLSNWYYHVGESEILWDKYVGVFGRIELFFNDITNTEQWTQKLNTIAELQDETTNNINYKFHPFNAVTKDDIAFLLGILKEINLLTTMICEVKGNLQKHLELLREKINIGKILDVADGDLTAEQTVIKTFYEVIKTMTDHSAIQNFDSMFFAQHLKNIIYNTEKETDEFEHDSNNYNLTMSNMLNLKKFRYVFAVGFEADKLPRKRRSSYPFTSEIIKVIKDLQVNSQELHYLTLNSVMDEFSFKNVLDLADEELNFSITESEGRKKNDYSVFVEDIATGFDSNIIFKKTETVKKETVINNQPELKPVNASVKKIFSVKELITFKLCPHLYFYLYGLKTRLSYSDEYHFRLFADNLMYLNLMDDFMEHNEKENRYYSNGDDEVFEVLEAIARLSFKKTLRSLDCFDRYKQKLMMEKALDRAKYFIRESAVEYAGYLVYSVRRVAPRIYDCDGFSLYTEFDTVVIGKTKRERRISQNKLYFDFLVMKSNDIKLDLEHYADMMKVLEQNKGYVDRIFLAKRMIDKINIQFDSGYFADDGKVRAKEIVKEIRETDFLTIKPFMSNFCNYCIMADACRFSKQVVREEKK